MRRRRGGRRRATERATGRQVGAAVAAELPMLLQLLLRARTGGGERVREHSAPPRRAAHRCRGAGARAGASLAREGVVVCGFLMVWWGRWIEADALGGEARACSRRANCAVCVQASKGEGERKQDRRRGAETGKQLAPSFSFRRTHSSIHALSPNNPQQFNPTTLPTHVQHNTSSQKAHHKAGRQ